MAVWRDVTERKRIEDALKETDRRKDELLAMLAHELRNPLAPIRNAVEVMRHLGLRDPQLDRMREDRAQGGLGIGLTLVRSIVEMHGGTVAAFSQGPGQGSEFSIRLPVLVDLPHPVQGDSQAASA